MHNLGRNWDKYCTVPNRCSTTFLLFGLGISAIALTFIGSTYTPVLVNKCPIWRTSERCSFSFFLFNLRLYDPVVFWDYYHGLEWIQLEWSRFHKPVYHQQWPTLLVALVECHAFVVGILLGPSLGILGYLYLPNDVQNIVCYKLCSSSFTWWNPSFASITEKSLALASFGSTSFNVGIWYLRRRMALFKSLGSMHILIFPGFMIVTVLLSQGVGSLTFFLVACLWVVEVLIEENVAQVALQDLHQYDNHLVSNPYLEKHHHITWSMDPQSPEHC